MKQWNASRLLAPAALAVAMGASGGAIAQQSGAQAGQEGAAPQAEALEVTDEQIANFAEAQAEVAEIGKTYTPKMQEAESKQAMQETRRKAQEEMVAAVKSSGLSVQKYNQIARAAQNDEALRSRIQSAQ
ncbi:DUF4168 domain-containing protein [Algiphilus sp.]|jgi:F0F1-type ATP synthase membrane subunit c/vacuolar-type H+-ATPase subunit K|uniref:DUF4168 domain-containing protein n=1 Tax=Algiphilus sp. TaxID=1872431 RepID=UPI001CA7B25C|nr:DUF4168 domain-containing protein [Algiphilus sp.]MBY8966295.1 DUF4168 domain-containing protein [Algiphilus acroporae]MCI5063841.1 DUF4168 domain-containing protein [Algiphilus sp.]MCI5102244.1 DUF4168 domain-containing protein [Algiphilus sp.]MCR9090396.1 DUF4168 domain-containing protein [Pseudomonadota bacterium]